jgi:hypothetical protein
MSAPSDALQIIRDRARDHEVFGELGRKSDDDVWFLARKQGDPALVALRLVRRASDEWGDPVYEHEVAREVGSDVSLAQARCVACSGHLRTFARFCGHCGADQTKGLKSGASMEERRRMLAEVRGAAAEHYDVLGELPRAEGGGVIYFALQRSNQALVQLRLRDAGDAMELGETRVQMSFDSSLTAIPVVGPRPSARVERQTPLGITAPTAAKDRPSAPVAAPPPPPPPAPAPAAASPREKLLLWAVIGLGVIVVIQAILLLR